MPPGCWDDEYAGCGDCDGALDPTSSLSGGEANSTRHFTAPRAIHSSRGSEPREPAAGAWSLGGCPAGELDAQIRRLGRRLRARGGASGFRIAGAPRLDPYRLAAGAAVRQGNVTLTGYDGCMKVQVQVQDRIAFGPELQVAKALLDEVLSGWTQDSRPEIEAVVDHAFSVGKEGRIDREALFGLRRLQIDDAGWEGAMQALTDSIRTIGTATYLRFYRRADARAGWEAARLRRIVRDEAGRGQHTDRPECLDNEPVRQICGAIGIEKTRLLLGARGGACVTAPAAPRPGQIVTDIVGVEAARALGLRFGAGTIDLPLGPRRRNALLRAAILNLRRAGASGNAVAATLGVAQRTVTNHLRAPCKPRGHAMRLRSTVAGLAMPSWTTGCAGPAIVGDSACMATRPIYLSEGAVAALAAWPEDRRAIAVHNRTWERVCQSQDGRQGAWE